MRTTINLVHPGVTPGGARVELSPAGGESLSLHAGDWVEVRSAEEIRATLDSQGCLDALPFMPEMLTYSGKRFRVFRVAHKACDTIKCYTARRMQNAVHLEGLRCDGSAHGGCQAACLLYWKEAWLKRVDGPAERGQIAQSGVRLDPSVKIGICDAEALERATQVALGGGAKIRYRCQATELVRATSPLPWWEPGQYVEDVASGNFSWREIARGLAIHLYNKMQKLWGGYQYPAIRPSAGKALATPLLNLQPGELVQVRSKEEIEATLRAGVQANNRGLTFDAEMLPYCGRTFRVLRRVERIVNERTGEMINIRNDCIMLEGVVCGGLLSRNRVGCSRAIYPYWREAWLRRVEGNSSPGAPMGSQVDDGG